MLTIPIIPIILVCMITKQEVMKMAKRIMTDEERGYKDRLAGYYDKWFRYNRSDDGAAYDRGCVRAVDAGKCPDHFTMIEACEAMRV